MPRSYEIVIQKTLDFLRANLSEPLDAAGIAASVGYSSSWLTKVFRKYTGKGPVSHLIDLRIDKAKELLSKTQLSISEVAVSSGFNSHTYFTTAFQKNTRLSPSDFRKHAKEEQVAGKPADQSEPTAALWFRDAASESTFARWWQPRNGE